MPLLSNPLPWYISGPLIGLLVGGLYAVANQRLGVSGAYLQVANFFHDRPRAEMWRVWFFVGMLCGSFVAGLLQGGLTLSLAYGALGVVLPLALLVSVLTLAASARIAGAILSEVGRNDATGPLQYLCWARGRSRVRTPGRNTARARHAAPRAG